MKRVSSGYLPETEPFKKLKVENTREFEGDLPVEIIKQIISFGSLFLRNKENLSSEYFETLSLVSKKWFVGSNNAAVHFLNSNFDKKISANSIFKKEMRIKNFVKRFGIGLESFIFSNYCNYGLRLFERNYTSEDIACLPNLTTIYYNKSKDVKNKSNEEELESIAEKCKKIKNVILGPSCDVLISDSILSGFEKIESLSIIRSFSFDLKAMAEKISNLKYLNLSWCGGNYKSEYIKGKFPLLEELDLVASDTDDAGLAEIKDSFPLLKKLSLSHCNVTNLEVISQSFPLLETLNLIACKVHLADIKDSYPLLQELHLSSSIANRELSSICNSFPLLTRLYLLSVENLVCDVILNFAKSRPNNMCLTIYIEINENYLNEVVLDGQWNKKIENLYPHIKIILVSLKEILSARFPNNYHYESES